MNIIERRNRILQTLNITGSVEVIDLADKFGLSVVTVRNDLKKLESLGLLVRFHGGATRIDNSLPGKMPIQEHNSADLSDENEVKLEDRAMLYDDAKTRIAHYAASLISPGNSIIIDSGSTTLKIAQKIASISDLFVVTNSLPAAEAVTTNLRITLVVCGGTFRHKTRSFHGTHAEAVFKDIVADYLFIGADGFDVNKGITTFNEGYAISKVMAKAVKKVVAVMDSTKFGKIGFNSVLAVNDIDILITDKGIDENLKAEIESKNVKVFTV